MQSSRLTREGSVGLLILLTLLTLGGIILWLKGGQLRRNSYQIKVDFPQASGLMVGSAVLYRGVQVGRVVSLMAKTNGVEAVLEISPAELRMPPELIIAPGSFGLLGEALVEITPQSLLTQDVGQITALSPDCNSQLIVCDQDSFQGTSGTEIFNSLAKIAELYGSEEFYQSLLGATNGIQTVTDDISSLSQELTGLVAKIERELDQFSANSTELIDSLTTTSDDIANLTREITVVGQNINDLIAANSDSIASTIRSINQSSDKLTLLLREIRPTIAQVDTALAQTDITALINNLEVLSANLKDFSTQLSSETNLLLLQQTLDSARATFANAEKITADLDQLTGDPQFRQNVKRLVDGLSQLVSSTQQLETKVQTAQVLNAVMESRESPPELILLKSPK